MNSFEALYFHQIKESLIQLYDRLPWKVQSIGDRVITVLKTLLFFVYEVRMEALLLQVGPTHANDRLSILFVGKKKRLKFIMSLMGINHCKVEKCANLYFWQIKRFLENRDMKADLIITNINKILYGLMRLSTYFRIPESVKSVLYLSGTLDQMKKTFHENVERKHRTIERSGYSYRILHGESAVRCFYYKMYTPYIEARFKEHAVIENYYKVRRLFRTGFLLVVKIGNSILAGAICRVKNGHFVFELVGIQHGDMQLLRAGALDALYYFSVILALKRKCQAIDFGISRPFLNDGLLMYKRKWGCALVPNKKQCREVGIRINGHKCLNHPIILDNYPVIFDDKDLSGCILLNSQVPFDLKYIMHIDKAYFNPGLKSLIVFYGGGFNKEVVDYCRIKSKGRIKLKKYCLW